MSDRRGRDRGKRYRCTCCVEGRVLHKERALQHPIDELLADDYSYEELMADTCTEDNPCELCLKQPPRTVRELLAEELDRLGVPHNLTDRAKEPT